MKIIVALILCMIGLPAIAQKISDLPETTSISNSYLFILARPGVANYKFTYSNLVASLEGDLNVSTPTNIYVENLVGSATNLTLIGNTTNNGTFVLIGGPLDASNVDVSANTLRAATLKAALSAGLNNLYVSNSIHMRVMATGAGYVLTDIAGNGDLTLEPPTGTGSTFSNKSMFYVSMTGDNSTAKQGRPDLPYRDPRAAESNAFAVGGGTVACLPGTYTTNNLGLSNVNYFAFPGVILDYVDNGSGPGRAIFDDRGKGALNCVIWGAWDIRYSTGLTGYNVGTDLITPNPTNNANLVGAFYITNHLSRLNVSGYSLSVTTLVTVPAIYAIHVKDCAVTSFTFDKIIDPIYTNTFFIGTNDVLAPYNTGSVMGGVYWESGECYVTAGIIKTKYSPVYANAPTSNASTQNFWVTVHGPIINNEAFTPVYLVGNTNSYKAWVTADEIIAEAFNAPSAVGFYNGGSFYVQAKKISAPTVAVIASSGTSSNWVTAQKMSSKAKWFDGSGGTTVLDCRTYEDNGGVTDGFNIIAGDVRILQGEATVLNGRGLNLSGSGQAKLNGVTINTSAGNLMTNTPVLVSTNGLILQNCVLVAPTVAPAIMASSGKTVLSYNGVTANKTNHPNITIQVGAFTVDANVR